MGLFKNKKEESKEEKVNIQNSTPLATSESIFIKSNEELNKTDGVVVIATIDNENVIPKESAMPAPIDIEKRKEQIALSKKEKIKNHSKQTKKSKSASILTSIIVLITIGIIGGTFYYYKNQKTPDYFELKDVNLELGSEVPKNVSYYLKQSNVDEMAFNLNIEEVDINTTGIYKYYVTHNGTKKEGKVLVNDTTSPVVETANQLIKLNDNIKPEDFISSCNDLSNCHYEFENPNIIKNIDEVGDYDIYIVIKDDFGNSTRKHAELKVVEELKILTCIKEDDMTEEYNYTLKDVLIIKQADGKYIGKEYYKLLSFINEESYLNSKKKYENQKNYIFDDKKLTIIMNQSISINYDMTLEEYQEMYTKEGYNCTIE